MPPSPSEPFDPSRCASFPSTLWQVLDAGKGDAIGRRRALEEICRSYWYPLYAFLRREGVGVADAQDQVQEFLTGLLEKDFLSGLDPQKGRFRSYVLTALKNHVATDRARRGARKRGGGRIVVSLDGDAAEQRYLAEPAHEVTAERLYEYRWARAVLSRAEERLAETFRWSGQEAVFEALRGCLSGEASASYAELAARLGKTEGALKVQVHRLRQRFGELVRDEIARTVASAGDVDEELRHLLDAIRLPRG
jgi:RNA polymerase sigma-70 factor (ECF subfamily)